MSVVLSQECTVRVEDHLGLVCSIVLKFIRRGKVEDSELYSVGCLALMEAARTFDPSKGKFATWAHLIVRQGVIDELKKNGRSRENSSCELSKVAEERSPSSPVHFIDDIIVRASEDGGDDNKMLLAHYLEGKSLSELGREFGFSKEWVRKRIRSAASKIRERDRHIVENHI